MERKFKIGDIVIGNSGANTYRVTIEGYKARVVDNMGIGRIGISPTLEGSYNSICFDVDEIHFDLFKKPVNSEGKLLKEALERYPIGTRVRNDNLGHYCAFTIKSTKFNYEPNENIVRYDSPSIGTYNIFKKGKWADIITTDESVVVSKPKFDIGDKVMISPTSRYIDQGYRDSEKLIGNVKRVYGSDPIYYVVVWTDWKKYIYEGKDLEPYLHNVNPRHVIGRGFNSSKFERIEKKTTSLNFQEPVIVNKTTGRKTKIITV